MALTIENFKLILRSAAGVDDESLLGSDFLDVSFADLGFDSLAILEVTNEIERSLRMRLPDDEVDPATTPRSLFEQVNDGGVLAVAER